MSIENLKEYERRCVSDADVREKAKAIGGSDLEGHMQFSESLGLSWTKADIAAYRKERVSSDEDFEEELSADDLELVSGGWFTTTAVSALVTSTATGSVDVSD